MSQDGRDLPADDERPRPDEPFLQRFHRRKTEARHAAEQTVVARAPTDDPANEDGGPGPARELTDADMPPIESLNAKSDYRGFLSTKVSESLRRAALRRLFHGAQFNVIDDLDDYAEDFTAFTALGDFVTADMRHRIQVEAHRQAEAFRQALLDDQPADARTEALAAPDHSPDTQAHTEDDAGHTARTVPDETHGELPGESSKDS